MIWRLIVTTPCRWEVLATKRPPIVHVFVQSISLRAKSIVVLAGLLHIAEYIGAAAAVTLRSKMAPRPRIQ